MELVFTADFHANFLGGSAAIGALAKARARGSLTLDTGDFLAEGFVTSRIALPGLEALQNRLFDALCPGNHGFGPAIRSPHALCCNLRASAGPGCAPWRIVERHGLRIGLTGIIGREAFSATPLAERQGWSASDPQAALDVACRQMRGQGVDQIIALSHSGFGEDIALAQTAPDVTAILSGHCHAPDMAQREGKILIAKAPELGAGIARLKLDAHGVRSLDVLFFAPDEAVAADDPVLAPIANALARVRQEAQEVVGRQTASRRRRNGDREAQLADLVRAISHIHGGKRVLINRSVFRELPVEAELTRLAIHTFIPFDNEIVEVPLPPGRLAASPAALERERVLDAGPADGVGESHILTTDYLAQNLFGLMPGAYRSLGQLRRVVTDILTAWDHRGHHKA